MGVLIEAENVVICNTTVEQRLPGGLAEYERRCPNRTFCTDGRICRVGFMSADDIREYITGLGRLGFAPPSSGGSAEIAWINSHVGFMFLCDWLQLGEVNVGDKKTQVAWLDGADPGPMIAPPGWKPGEIYFAPWQDLDRFEYLRTEETLEVYRDKITGELTYLGRTQRDSQPSHSGESAVQGRMKSIFEELTLLGAFAGAVSSTDEAKARACFERSRQLVNDTQASLPGPLMFQGVAARLLQRWDDAASLFQRVNELLPQQVDGWLELTWALAALRRFEEAEHAARTAIALAPNHVSALSNLAAVLLQRDRFEEACSAAGKVLEVNPADAIAQNILATAKRKAAKKRPWWRTLIP
jgi:hypothetical protein